MLLLFNWVSISYGLSSLFIGDQIVSIITAGGIRSLIDHEYSLNMSDRFPKRKNSFN